MVLYEICVHVSVQVSFDEEPDQTDEDDPQPNEQVLELSQSSGKIDGEFVNADEELTQSNGNINEEVSDSNEELNQSDVVITKKSRTI